MATSILRSAAIVCLLSLGGCGLLYTDVTVPLVVNMHNTPNVDTSKQTELSQEKVMEPFFGIQVEVDSIAIGDAAKKTGLHEVYYADLRTVSVLFGIYVKRTIIVTGN